jgi:RNA polymerase sigma factor (sigma-70 family)
MDARMNRDETPEWIRSAMDRYQRPLTAYARRLVGDGHASDVVQETFLKLCSRSPAVLNGSLMPWLYTVCRSRAMDIKRKEKRMTLALEETIDRDQSPANDPAQLAEQTDSASQIVRLMAHLPANQQEVLRLKFQHALSYRDIAGVTGLSETNVGFLISTGLKTIRDRLREKGAL